MQLSEWVPNPKGKDTLGEWIEFFNESEEEISTAGWKIVNSQGKSLVLSGGRLQPGEYAVLAKPELKLTLRNQSDKLSLYSPRGELVDEMVFQGQALEGKSFGRDLEGRIGWLEPTPGAVNQLLPLIRERGDELIGNIVPTLSFITPLSFLLGTAIFLIAFLLYTVKQDAYLENLLFKRNQKTDSSSS